MVTLTLPSLEWDIRRLSLGAGGILKSNEVRAVDNPQDRADAHCHLLLSLLPSPPLPPFELFLSLRLAPHPAETQELGPGFSTQAQVGNELT